MNAQSNRAVEQEAPTSERSGKWWEHVTKSGTPETTYTKIMKTPLKSALRVRRLDVSVRAQVLNLMRDLQKQHDLTYLFISHDMSVVRYISDRIAVMYLGRIVELAPCDTLFREPAHPYTKALLSAIPQIGRGKKRERILLKGDVRKTSDPEETGCPFYPRCPEAREACRTARPELHKVGEEHLSACLF